MQVLNSSVARPWKLEQNTSGQASRQALRASRLWKLEQNSMTKKGPFFGPQNIRKQARKKLASPVFGEIKTTNYDLSIHNRSTSK